VQVFWRKPATNQPPLAGWPWGASWRLAGFTLVELLVAVAIVIVLLLLSGAAFQNARASQAKQATQSLITKINDVVSSQFASYAERRVPDATSSEDRSIRLRRLASAEMPDSWADVEAIANEEAVVPRTPAQDVYVSIWRALQPTDDYGDAECLFMVVMQSGLSDCLDCVALGAGDIGDVDNDGAPEFLDAWGQPIRYVLWPAALELPPGGSRHFSTTAPFSMVQPAGAPGGIMRPLVFSRGPDGLGSIKLNATGNLALGNACGDPQPADPTVLAGGFGIDPIEFPREVPDDETEDGRPDNITNVDAEARR
jgi:type II secretory pathway pseudopilin PulG